jgi:hypothetical protein
MPHNVVWWDTRLKERAETKIDYKINISNKINDN